ncbi:MAG: 7-cyano-7-deazaguanine synthase [archaeon]
MKRKLISLMSGGIDSPVAAYKMMKKGHEVIFLHFHNYTTTSNDVKNKITDLIKVLSKHQKKIKLYLVPFQEAQKEIIKVVPSRYRMIVYRRMMFKIGEKILQKEKAHAFLTGDSLGQVASQTLDNISVIFKATDKVIATPLIGEDKTEIIKTAREIGTYEISIRPYNDCCTFFNAKHPATRADLKTIEDFEKNLKIKQIIKNAVKKVGIVRNF